MTAWYNEIDPYAADWLENLIKLGEIAPGIVDRRSIEDVRPDELTGFTQCHFFAGVGVWSRALRLAGWPDNRPVWTGSCPCQPFSAAGKGAGIADDRHLWPAWDWLIEYGKPGGVCVLGEQVASSDGLAWLDIVSSDLEGKSHACWPFDLCAAGVGSPNIRQRLFFAGIPADGVALGDTIGPRLEGHGGHGGDGHQPGRLGEDEAGPASPPGAACGVEHATGHGRQQWRPEPGERGLAAGCGAGRLAHADGRDAGAERQQRGGEQRFQSADGGLVYLDHGGRPGPVNGLWANADWIFCRDGKWRPVKSGTQSLAYGPSSCMGPCGTDQIKETEKEIGQYVHTNKINAREALHDLWWSLSSAEIRGWTFGGLSAFHEPEILLYFLLQLTVQGWAFAESLPCTRAEAAEGQLRGLRHAVAASCASRKRGLDGQPTGEHSDAVRALSSILARHAQAAWGKAFISHAADAFPLIEGAAFKLGSGSAYAGKSRAGMLKGYGNAINAETAAGFIACVMQELGI